ncbi:MAG: hypothetical protein ABIJ86_03005 [Spirochaetota bacterium]
MNSTLPGIGAYDEGNQLEIAFSRGLSDYLPNLALGLLFFAVLAVFVVPFFGQGVVALATFLTGIVLTLALSFIARRFRIAWLGNFILAFSLFLAMSSFVPLLGSGASYLSFETGNVSNIKLPCAMNAPKLAAVQPASEEGEVLSTISVAVSSMVTTGVIVITVLLLTPLALVFAHPSVRIVTANVLPALFGSLMVAFLAGGDAGPVTIKGQWKAIILPFSPGL